MSFRAYLSLGLVVVASSLAVGCSGAGDDGPSTSASSAPNLTLQGTIGDGAVATKTFGLHSRANLHVRGHELHARGARGAVVEAAVAADGSFRLDLERGKRWVVTVDGDDDTSAIVTFASGSNVLDVDARSGAKTWALGAIALVGGEARTSARTLADLGLALTLAAAEDVYIAANGAVIVAQAATAEARRAADEAMRAGQAAESAGNAAERAAEQARKAAGL